MVPRKFALLLIFIPSLIPLAAGQEPLTEKTTQAIDRAVAAFREGRLGEVLSQLEPVIQAKTPDELQPVGQELREVHGLDMSALELAAFCRVELALTGNGGRLSRPPTSELPVVLEALDDRISLLLEPVRREVEVGMPAIVPDDVMHEKISTIRALLTHIDQANLLAAHIQRLAGQLHGPERAALEPRPREIANRKLADEQKKLDGLRDRLTSRLVEYSLVRLNSSLNTILDDTTPFQRHIQAIETAGNSLAIVNAHWDRYKKWKQLNGGFDPSIEQRWRRQAELVRLQAGPFLQKAFHFVEGCNWWLRGRYGMGPLSGGLAKVVPSGIGEKAVLQALLNQPLSMPRVLTKPQDPLAMPAAYPVARRHLESWQVENRSVQGTPPLIAVAPPVPNIFLQTPDRAGTKRGYGEAAWVNTSQTPEIHLAQLVGYQEYSLALYHFEQLISLATPAELRILDDRIGQDDRFLIHSNLSGKYDNLDPASRLRLPPRVRDPRAARPHERRGLAWVMALARVEVGAMRTGFTSDPIVLIPHSEFASRTAVAATMPGDPGSFGDRPPTPFERDAFLELLLDGSRQHFYETLTEYRIAPPRGLGLAMDNERLLPNAERGATLLRLLQLSRKLKVASGLIDAFRFYSNGSLDPAQQNELDRWGSQLLAEHFAIQRAMEPPRPLGSGPRFPSRFDTVNFGPAGAAVK